MALLNFWKKSKKEQRVDRAPTPPPAEKKPSIVSRAVQALGKEKETPVRSGDTKQAPNVLLYPIVTEKTTQSGTYAFQVPTHVSRTEVKKAIAALYGVTPVKVNMLSFQGKPVRFGRTSGRRSDWKKAVVYLKPGATIAVE